jgi:putative aldouronate transport system substrate-binding protein
MKLATKRSSTTATLLVVLALLLAACSGGGEEAEVDEEDLGTITAMVPFLEAQAPASDGRMHQAIEEFTGKSLDVTWVPNAEYEDRTAVTLASDDIPEILVVQGKIPPFVQSAEAGAFWDLTDRLDDYPNLVPQTPEGEQILANSSVNGTVYGIFRGRDPMRAAVILRKDWLANLGLELPETVDDLYEVARAFTQDDPDGNGQDDTYGMILPQWPGAGYGTASPYDFIETWFGAPNRWGEIDGQLVPGFDTPEFLEAMRFMKRMVDEGLVNPDYATLNPDNWNDPFINGQGGIIVDVSSRAGVIMELLKEADPDNYGDYVTMAGNLIGPDGERHSYPTVGYLGFLAISRQSVPTEEELDDILTVLNELAGDEGQILMNNGIEGENFTVTAVEEEGKELPGLGIGYAAPIEDDPDAEVMRNDARAFAQMSAAPSAAPSSFRGYDLLPGDPPEQELWDHRWAIHDRDMETAVHDPTQPLVSETEIARGAQLNQIVHDARIQYLAGQIDEAGLQAELERWHAEGGDDIVDEMNELYAQLDR